MQFQEAKDIWDFGQKSQAHFDQNQVFVQTWWFQLNFLFQSEIRSNSKYNCKRKDSYQLIMDEILP